VARLVYSETYQLPRIIARTGGLLEVHGKGGSHLTVSFLHRTVAEFLHSEDMVNDIHTRLRPNFDVYLALAKMNTVQLKSDIIRAIATRRWLHTIIFRYSLGQ